MPLIHHTAICTRDVDESLRFWRDGLGFDLLMDEHFDGDWPTLLHAPSTSLRSVFLGRPGHDAGIVELVDLGLVGPPGSAVDPPTHGFLLVSLMADVDDALGRLAALGLGGTPRRTTTRGVEMAVVTDPDGVLVELIGVEAIGNLGAGEG
ncbi:MAG: VOC family protein [Acidimicrobiales bacterium]|jgi:glyoxylase I family protein|nr:VOC family protein [Acidimicrobiales bacterium]